jgi:hypothetical protein
MQVRIRGYRDRRVTKSSGDRFEIRAGGEHYRRVQRVIFGHVTASKRRLRAYEANAPVCRATGDRKVAPSGGAVCLGLRAGKSHTEMPPSEEQVHCQNCGRTSPSKGAASWLCEHCDAQNATTSKGVSAGHPGYTVKTKEGVVHTVAPETRKIAKSEKHPVV